MFRVGADEIKDFDGQQLVRLLRILLYAEARQAKVPLRNVDAPLQINVPDGGQDATVRWSGGVEKTDFFPRNDIVFQCKATDHGPSQWKSEVWTKASQRQAQKVLNPAVKDAVARKACYIGITATPLVGTKPNDRVKKIREAIVEAGENAGDLLIKLYDGNQLAEWASRHPAAALWIKEQGANLSLASFATLDQWGRRSEITSPPFCASSERKFSLGADSNDTLGFDQLGARIVDHLSEAGACARIWGASGIGKTRALFHALGTAADDLDGLTRADFIFCAFPQVRSRIWDVANSICNEGRSAVLVVDDCPWEESRKLFDLAKAEGSQLRVITIGTDGANHAPGCLMIRPHPADAGTIAAILKAGIIPLSAEAEMRLVEVCDGFPRIAVMATAGQGMGHAVLTSLEDAAVRILETASVEPDTLRALEGLALFEGLDPDEYPRDFDTLSEMLVHMKGELMFEHLVKAADGHFVGRSNRQMVAQPRPIADYLAARRLRYLRPSTIRRFLFSASGAHRAAMLGRWRYLAGSPTLTSVVRDVVYREELKEPTDLLGGKGDPFLAAFVHVDPDSMGNALGYAIRHRSLDELAQIHVGPGLLHALRLLASRSRGFVPAARLVLRLAAVAERESEARIVDLLCQLFQIALAGTKADDNARREALSDFLDEEDSRLRGALVEALGAMLTTRLSRSNAFEQIASDQFGDEWWPAHRDTVLAYYRWALQQLLRIWNVAPDFRDRIEKAIVRELRGLMEPDLYDTIEPIVRTIVEAHGHWFAATKSIGDWLYFDRPDPGEAFALKVRALYDLTLPSDPVGQVLLYTRFWSHDLRDPDALNSPNASNHEYAARKVESLAPVIADDPDSLARVIAAMASEDMKASHIFASAVAEHLTDPLSTFGEALAVLEASSSRSGVPFLRSLLSALDRQLSDDLDRTNALEEMAMASSVLAENPMDVYTALRLTDERMETIISKVESGLIEPGQVIPISYGRGLESVPISMVGRLVRALVEDQSATSEIESELSGPWAALEILSLFTHGMQTITPELAQLVKLTLASSAILNVPDGASGHGDYVVGRMIALLEESSEIDGDFARTIAVQIEHACRTPMTGRYRTLEGLRKIVPAVVGKAPGEIWAVVAGVYATATEAERDRLNQIVGATKRFAGDGSHSGPGALFGTPESLMLDWVDKDPGNRIAFLLSFYPILERNQIAGTCNWHPALQRLADSYGALRSFGKALRLRIFPRSWSGGLDVHFAEFREPLESWAHAPSLDQWSRSVLQDIDAWLESHGV